MDHDAINGGIVMLDLRVGMKLYSYCYGEMTVESVNENSITVHIDDWDGVVSQLRTGNGQNATKVFLKAAVGHWIFTSKSQVGTENNRLNCMYQPKDAIEVKPEYRHRLFSNSKLNRDAGLSPVGSYGGNGLSPVGSYNDENNGRGLSPVGSYENNDISPVGSYQDSGTGDGLSPVGSDGN